MTSLADVTTVAEVAEAASDVSALINNAGIARGASVLDRDSATLREEMEAKLFGPLAMASVFADRIAERSGAVVKVASVLADEMTREGRAHLSKPIHERSL
jgi:NAD(P)-dependent dehydrogenase (short-subunit alcohol dehydrogenase family)